jgi:hypothetical protein
VVLNELIHTQSAHPGGAPGDCPRGAHRRPVVTLLVAILGLLLLLASVAACDSGGEEGTGGGTTSTTGNGATKSGDVEGSVGEALKVGKAVITVRALEATFQPAVPEQRLSEEIPAAPGSGESFYQAYVRVENTGIAPIRVDAEDFACAVGEAVVSVEPTRSGPLSRSLLLNSSLDLVLTFKAQASYEPILIYQPPWYDGVITISPAAEETTTTTR